VFGATGGACPDSIYAEDSEVFAGVDCVTASET